MRVFPGRGPRRAPRRLRLGSAIGVPIAIFGWACSIAPDAVGEPRTREREAAAVAQESPDRPASTDEDRVQSPENAQEKSDETEKEKEAEATRKAKALLVGVEILAASLDAEDIRIVDARNAAAFALGHVPGAVPIDLDAWARAARGDRREDTEFWAGEIRKLGLKPETRVVVYADNLPTAARAWWTLKYVGVPNVALLDGGWAAWKKAERETTLEGSSVEPRDFAPKFQRDRLALTAEVKSGIGKSGLLILDTRSDAEVGAGCIPGAKHIEWTRLVGEDGRFQPRDELRRIFEAEGASKGAVLVPY
jgi:thiosulfate/3-mercaptopyruvate sulfurtransferase